MADVYFVDTSALGKRYIAEIGSLANALRSTRGEPPIILLSSDSELNTAAVAEHLMVDDPNSHP